LGRLATEPNGSLRRRLPPAWPRPAPVRRGGPPRHVQPGARAAACPGPPSAGAGSASQGARTAAAPSGCCRWLCSAYLPASVRTKMSFCVRARCQGAAQSAGRAWQGLHSVLRQDSTLRFAADCLARRRRAAPLCTQGGLAISRERPCRDPATAHFRRRQRSVVGWQLGQARRTVAAEPRGLSRPGCQDGNIPGFKMGHMWGRPRRAQGGRARAG